MNMRKISGKASKLYIVMAIMAVIMCMVSVSAYAVTSEIDGFDPLLDVRTDEAGRTIVPVRGLVEWLGGEVGWNGDTQAVTIDYEYRYTDFVDGKPVTVPVAKHIEFKVGDAAVSVNGETTWMDTVPQIIDGSTYVPVRYIAEALDAVVEWDGADQVVEITSAPNAKGYDMVGAFTVPKDRAYEAFVVEETYMGKSVGFVIDYSKEWIGPINQVRSVIEQQITDPALVQAAFDIALQKTSEEIAIPGMGKHCEKGGKYIDVVDNGQTLLFVVKP